MSISSINDVVAATLRENGQSDYIGFAGPVVAQLVAREQEMSGALIEYADNAGIGADAARELLASIGMSVSPAPEPNEDDTTELDVDDEDLDLADQIRNLAQTVNEMYSTINRLNEFARANGFRG
jgi:hypothetical protein